LDLIYGLPGQTKTSWLSDLRMAVALKPEHLSCYMLTYEPGTEMEKDMRAKKFEMLHEGLSGAIFETTIDFLGANDYFQYEVSNFALSLEGMSRHNMKYWSFVPYIGIGSSAHSFNDPVRYWNIRSVKKYIRETDAGRQPVEAKEVLNRDQHIMEAILLGLRKTEGIPIDTFNKMCEVDFMKIFGEVISDLEEKGFLKLSQNKCALTQKGMLFLDSIVSIFVNQRFDPCLKK
jgi:oxygen-independent coproporphyrinogen-3 oxidase